MLGQDTRASNKLKMVTKALGDPGSDQNERAGGNGRRQRQTMATADK